MSIKTQLRLHARNRNKEKYDIEALTKAVPKLKEYIFPNKKGEPSIIFSEPKAVKLLNRAILNYYYGITNWDFSDENLCPPIPGRADYIHHIADLLKNSNSGVIPTGEQVNSLDIGIGATAIYPLIGIIEYGWQFVGVDVNEASLVSSTNIAKCNPTISGQLITRLQKNSNAIFNGIIKVNEKFDITICNPPFHSTSAEAHKSRTRKTNNLSVKKNQVQQLNFAGTKNELIFNGGELQFILNIITDSTKFSRNCFWFTTLVSKQSNLKTIYRALKEAKVKKMTTILLATGNKSSRIVAWTFLNELEQSKWRNNRWKTPGKS